MRRYRGYFGREMGSWEKRTTCLGEGIMRPIMCLEIK
jgi:hypothetical protein